LSPTQADERSRQADGPDGDGAWERVCAADDVWEGEMSFRCLSDGTPVLLVNADGQIRAYRGTCPHQHNSLADADLDDGVITCPAHLWEFDASTGAGINPSTARLAEYPTSPRDTDIYVKRPRHDNGKAAQP
jgi:toluene monooxygenase system ferredoxin subunit